MKKFNKVFLLMTLSLTIFLAACSSGDEDTITFGSRNNTESIILSNIMGQLVENHTDLKVERKDNLGGSDVLWSAVLKNDIQVIPDYTGTIVANYYNETPGTADETFARAKELIAEDDLLALETFGFNNTYTLAVADAIAKEHNLVTFSDFAKISDRFTFGAVFEFIDRPDGLPGFEKAYNIHFKEVKGMDHGMMYRAFGEGDVDVINSYSTDGQLQDYDLTVLEDDLSFFPPYHAMPIVRKDMMEKHPELEEVLNLLANKIDEDTMQEMNGKVDNDGIKVEAVAKEFLENSELLK